LGAAELHPPDASPDSQPEIAFSVEMVVRRRGVGSKLFRELIAEANRRDYRILRITTGADNDAMRALALKFGAHLSFCDGESTGTIILTEQPQFNPARLSRPAALEAARAIIELNRDYWKALLRIYGWRWAA
jgi:GNAT superfamily N-acetyltransferase